MSKDQYANFAALKDGEREGEDYRICVTDRASPVGILAPHGGYIEPHTSEIAAAIAGDTFSLYCFEGLRPGRGHSALHIASSRFDEPKCLALVGSCCFIIAVHGRAEKDDDKESVWLGGRDTFLRDAISAKLKLAGFQTTANWHPLPGTEPNNICNRGQSGGGAQLELPMGLRKKLHEDGGFLASFAATVRLAVDRRLAGSTP